MASGNILNVFTPGHNEPPASNPATPDTRNAISVLDFDPSTDEAAVFRGVLPDHYGGGGLTVEIYWMATSATSGACRWEAAIERDDLSTDHDSDSFASAQSAGTTASGTSGVAVKTSIAFTSGAQMDSLAASEPFRLKINRDANGTTGTDDMTGDAELLEVVVKET